jgi:hypothetical protein
VKTVDGERATTVRFDRYLATLRVASSETLVPVMAPVAVVMTGCPPPSNNSAWEVLVWWVDGASTSGNGS